jgi:hypothetical protein
MRGTGGVRAAAAVVAAMAVGLFAAAPAGATYHEMRIRAIFKGPTDVSFVELQMTQPGQNLTAGRKLTYYDSTATTTHSSPVFTDVAHGDNQRTILIADTAQPTTPDFTWGTLWQNINSDANGGAICYENIDCVAWGPNFTGGALLPSPAGTPLSNLSSSQVAARNITANCPTALDNADDTNDSAADFSFVVGFPVRANSATPTETVCPPAPGTVAKAKCKKKKRKKSSSSAQAAKKKKCKKKKKRR